MKINLILLFAITTFAFTQTAEITNITASQRTDGSGIVDICYDLQGDVNFSIFSITTEISFDQGSIWNSITNATGDFGNNIEEGMGKCFVWNFSDEFGELYTPDAHLRIHADSAPLPPEAGNFDMVSVPAGDYTYGQNDQTLNIDYDFEMSKYEITNAQFVAYLIEALEDGSIYISGDVYGFYTGDENYGPGNQRLYDLGDNTSNYNYGRINWNGTTFTVTDGYGNHPVVYVTWFGAQAFAQHYGMRLPNEYEWEKTARGSTGYDYPFGNTINNTNANYNYNENGTTPVGYYDGINVGTVDAPSQYGAYDMAGNAWEWTNDWYNEGSSSRVWRGGSWGYNYGSCHSWDRGSYYSPTNYYNVIGFRVARTQ
jgi:formylglycine-generating enzyme required for sulfatase activity